MSFRLISSGGSNVDPTVVNMPCSGTIRPGEVVDLLRTGGQGVSISSGASTSTMVFGVSLDYKEGKSDAEAKVIPFTKSQLWAADCYNTPLTSHIGIRHIIRTTLGRGAYIENTATDAANVSFGVFLALGMDTTKGTGVLVGRFIQNDNTEAYPDGNVL